MYRDFRLDMEDMTVSVQMPEFFTLNEELTTITHNHPDYEVLYVPYGTLEYKINDKKYIVSENSILIIPPSVLHEPGKVAGDTLRFSFSFFLSKKPKLNTGMHKKCNDLLLKTLKEPMLINFRINDIEELRRCFMGIYSIDKSLPDFTECMVYSYVTIILSKILYALSLRSGGASEDNAGGVYPPEITSPRVVSISQYINTHYNKNPSVVELSSELHLSVRQTERLMKKYMGASFSELLNRHRTKLVQRKIYLSLANGEKISFTDMAENVGFTNYYTFLKQFKIHAGTSPNVYKKSIEKEIGLTKTP